VVDELDCRQEIEYVHEILKMGTGADRQLEVFHETGDLKQVVDFMAEETAIGLDAPAAARATEARRAGGAS
jgi:carboxylate-amine ligase